MKPLFIGLIFVAATASASAQTPILPQIFGSSASDRVTVSGCVTGGGVAAGPSTMMNPAIVPSTVAPWQRAPAIETTSLSPVGTTGTTGSFPIGPVALSYGTTLFSGTDAGAAGYLLTGSDLSSWLGLREQVTGALVPLTPEIVPAPSAAGFEEFHVQSVMPLTGPCPQR
jgi:hypothetical protein